METGAGARLGKYVIASPLAETRMSRVWLAREAGSDRLLALKTIRLFPGNEDIVEAARVGAMLQQMLCERDTRVVRVNEYGETDGCFYIDMEYIEGKDVSQILAERGHIEPGLAVKIALEVAEVLDNLHSFSANIDGRQLSSAVHGDLKPKNIRIAGELNGSFAVKALDFGTAKALSQSKPTGTRTPAWSPAYASPELLDRREMNPLSDRWALGVTLYEMVTGRIPFGAGKGVEEMEEQILHRPDMPDLGVPGCPAALHAILFKLLNPDPGQRYQTAQELCLDLRNYPEMPKLAGYQGETVRSNGRPSAGAATTRRSSGPPVPAAAPAAPAAVPRRRPDPPSASTTIRRAAVFLALCVLAVWWVVREQRAMKQASALRADLVAERVNGPDASARLSALRDTWLVWFPDKDIVRMMNAQFLSQGDEIVTRFRIAPLPAAEWQQARRYFEQALQNNPGDTSIQGRLHLCDGHLKRFQSQSEKDPALIPVAAAKFEDAARLLPRSPDPFLGLAMLQLYNQHDPEKADNSLASARGRNFDFTAEGRWVSLLAECYRMRADALYNEGLRMEKTLPDQARERMRQAIDFHQKAITWYSGVPLYGKSLQMIERSRQSIERIQWHMSQPVPGQR